LSNTGTKKIQRDRADVKTPVRKLQSRWLEKILGKRYEKGHFGWANSESGKTDEDLNSKTGPTNNDLMR